MSSPFLHEPYVGRYETKGRLNYVGTCKAIPRLELQFCFILVPMCYPQISMNLMLHAHKA